MKINVETSVIDPIMIKKLHQIEAMTGADLTVNIREIVTYIDDTKDMYPKCNSCGNYHYPNKPCQEKT